VSVTADFFRLGGDSIKSIQLASRLRRRLGIELTVKEVFALRTARRIAAKAQSGHAESRALTEQGRLRGAAGLLPIQGWFFGRLAAGELRKPGHFNQAVRIGTGRLDEGLLEMSARKLVEQHDAFRLRYRNDGDGKVIQYYEEEAPEAAVKIADIRGKSEEAVEELLTGWQSEFDVWGDSLYSIGYLMGEGEAGELHLAMHHLLTDGVSWRIIKEDLERIYRRLEEGAKEGKSREELEGMPVEEILGRKGTSYRQWAARVKEYGEKASEREREYWAEETKGIAAHNAALEGLYEEAYQERELQISKELTGELLTTANAKYHTEINDILLGSLSLALWKLTGKEENYATVEGHGREELEGTDITRTAGWFTTMWPVRLEAAPGDIVATIVRVKERIRKLPGKGFGYGAAYGYDGELPKAVFNYLGQFESGGKRGGWGFSAGGVGRTAAAENRESNLLSINGAVRGGELGFSIGGHLGAGALERFVEEFRVNVETAIARLSEGCRSCLTPSDTGWALSQGQLDRLQRDRELEWAGKANSLQEGFIYQNLRNGEADDAYIVQSVWNYREAIEAGKMREAWEQAQKKYPALRLRFDWEEELAQVVEREVELDWRYYDISGEAAQEAYIEGLRARDREERYDLSQGRLFRIYLIRRGEEYYTTIYSAHHAIMDGWSMPILMDYTHRAYAQLRAGERPVEEEDRSYLETQEYLRRHEGEGREYWEGELRKQEEEDLSGLLKGSRCGEQISEYRWIEEPGEAGIELGGKAYEGIKQYSLEQGITMSALAQYAWHRELAVYGRSATTVTGMTVSGRELPVEGIESSVGLYINTLPVVYEHREGPVEEGLRRLQATMNEAGALSQTRLGDLGEGARRFSSLFVYENYPVPEGAVGGLKIEYVKGVEKLDYPLGVVAYERDGRLGIGIKYAGELFEQDTILGLLEGMRRTLEQIAGGGKLREEELGHLGEGDYKRIVYEWNRTERAYPGEKTVGELFEEQTEQTPGNIAVAYEGKLLSYRELNEQANRMAGYLRKEHGIGPDGLVALCLDRSEQMVAAILGVVKAGGAYVPLSPEYPDERIGYMLRDSGAKVVLTNGKYEGRLRGLAGVGSRVESVDSDSFNEAMTRESSANPERRAGPENLVYAMYTSGTTGEPKGVLIEHRGFINLVESAHDKFGLSRKEIEVILFFTEYVFDMSVKQIFLALLHGHKLVVTKDNSWMDGDALIQMMNRERVTFINTTPSLLWQLELEKVGTLKIVNAGGEAVTPELLNRMRGKPFVFLNAYGPTETTIVSHVNIGVTDTSIGRPMFNTTSYILDDAMRPLPIGAAGELYIGGVGVARGYLNKPELTAERFINNPFQTGEEKGYNGRLYKTGDLARYLPDGNIEYLGRNDSQVKIRGFRIELGEIENALLGYPGVKQCVAVAKDRGESGKYLAAYYAGEGEIDEAGLRAYLSGKLPEYMAPSVYKRLEKFPLTANGKLDRRALPEPEFTNDEGHEKPQNDAEMAALKIFAGTLGLEEGAISVTENFFRLGGNSIMAIKLANRLRRELGMGVRVADIFTCKTVRKLAEQFGGRKGEEPKIERAVFNRTEEQKLSFAQGRLWFIEKYESGSNAYNVPMAGKLAAGVSIKSIKRAVEEIVRRHEVLRSVIRTDEEGEGYQEAIREPFRIEEEHYEDMDALRAGMKREVNCLFNLETEYPIRVKIHEKIGEKHISVMIHHIAFDGWSQDIFLNELGKLYRYYENGGEYPLGEVELQYKDYAVWQRKYLSGESLAEQIKYWKERLDGYETLNLPVDRERPPRVCYDGDDAHFSFDESTSKRIRRLAKELGVSVYTALLSAYYLLLSIYSNQKDIVVGTVVANREYPELSGTIGFFANTLPMRQQINAEQDVQEFIREVGEKNVEAQRHQELPFERLVEELGVEKDESRHPVFQVAFTAQDFLQKTKETDGIFVGIKDNEGIRQKAAKFDLQLSMEDNEGKIGGVFDYALSLFNRETIEGYIRSYREIIRQIIEGKGKRINEISALDGEERNRIVYEWNRTEHEYPADKTIVKLFEEQAEKTPERIAVVYEEKTLSYQELNEMANRVACYLAKQYGIGDDDLIALCLDRSELMPAMMLGSLKAGGAYVPVSPDYPDERIQYLLGDTKAKVALTNEKYGERIRALAKGGAGVETIDGAAFRTRIGGESGENPEQRAGPGNLAYVIYTSGTTGEPKGVMLEHRGLVNLALRQGDLFGLCSQDGLVKHCLWYANYVFDAHVWELFTVLTHGHRLYIASDEQRMDLGLLERYIQENKINIGTIPPALLNRETTLPLDTIVMAGEVSSRKVMEAYIERGVLVINAYGPTEGTVCASCHRHKKGEGNRNIGHPMWNMTCYILDGNLKPLPVGAEGELCIGGAGIARGYLNKPELTAERFIKNPFQTEEEKARGRNGVLYKTGDLARHLPDGNIEYLGRNDFQVKVRGFRIELGEIESKMLEYAGVKQSVVVTKERGGEKYLAAYYVGEEEIKAVELRAYLEGKLPEYMVPNTYMKLDSLPLTASGKLDRRALPELEYQGENGYEGPRNDTERELMKIFAGVLGLDEGIVSVTGDFFRLGGNSIMAIKLAHRIHRELGKSIRVADIFAHRTIRNIVERTGDKEEERPRICRKEFKRTEEQKLSFAQERMWFIEKYEEGSGAYNVPMTGKLADGMSAESIKKAIAEIVRRHEVLRSVIQVDEDGEGYQEATEEPFVIEEEQYNDMDALREGMKREVNRLFNVEMEFPIRVKIHEACGEKHISIVAHHIAFDGWSQEIFSDELAKLCRRYENGGEYPLEEVAVQYKDYAAWQREYVSGETLTRQLAYWKEKLTGYETLSLPTDRERSPRVCYDGDDVYFSFDELTSGKIRHLAKELRVSVYTVLLSAYYLLLSAYSGQNDIVIGTVVANREYPELSGTIGFFANTLAMRQEVDLEGDIHGFIERVGASVGDALLNQDISFETLVSELETEKHPGRHPIFQTSFSLQSSGEDQKENLRGILTESDQNIAALEYKSAKFDLSLSMIEGRKTLSGNFNYATSLFDKETIESYSETYKEIIAQIVGLGAQGFSNEAPQEPKFQGGNDEAEYA
jgi:amino acid adenylation domain-containing protein/non-ribosomal peptide synthase protein (TIGR01720 family)